VFYDFSKNPDDIYSQNTEKKFKELHKELETFAKLTSEFLQSVIENYKLKPGVENLLKEVIDIKSNIKERIPKTKKTKEGNISYFEKVAADGEEIFFHFKNISEKINIAKDI